MCDWNQLCRTHVVKWFMTAYIEQGIVSAQQMQLSNTVVTSRLLKQSTNSCSCSMKNLIFEIACHQSTLKKFEAINKVHGKTVVFYKKWNKLKITSNYSMSWEMSRVAYARNMYERKKCKGRSHINWIVKPSSTSTFKRGLSYIQFPCFTEIKKYSNVEIHTKGWTIKKRGRGGEVCGGSKNKIQSPGNRMIKGKKSTLEFLHLPKSQSPVSQSVSQSRRSLISHDFLNEIQWQALFPINLYMHVNF